MYNGATFDSKYATRNCAKQLKNLNFILIQFFPSFLKMNWKITVLTVSEVLKLNVRGSHIFATLYLLKKSSLRL